MRLAPRAAAVLIGWQAAVSRSFNMFTLIAEEKGK